MWNRSRLRFRQGGLTPRTPRRGWWSCCGSWCGWPGSFRSPSGSRCLPGSRSRYSTIPLEKNEKIRKLLNRKENNVYPTTSVPWEVGDGGEWSDEVEERPRDDDAVVNVEEEDNHHRRDPNAWKHEARRENVVIIMVYFDSLAQQTSHVNEALHSC